MTSIKKKWKRIGISAESPATQQTGIFYVSTKIYRMIQILPGIKENKVLQEIQVYPLELLDFVWENTLNAPWTLYGLYVIHMSIITKKQCGTSGRITHSRYKCFLAPDFYSPFPFPHPGWWSALNSLCSQYSSVPEESHNGKRATMEKLFINLTAIVS